MSSQPRPRLTAEEYLAVERKAEFKSEFFDGEMFAMSGASFRHGRLGANLLGALQNALRRNKCTAVSSDVRISVRPKGAYCYPDATIVCDEPRFIDNEFDTLLNPAVIFEILSPSTEAYDRGFKFENYRTIESLQEYVLISQDRIHVDVYRRQPGNSWVLSEAKSLEEAVELHTAGVTLSLADLYDRVRFEAEPGATGS